MPPRPELKRASKEIATFGAPPLNEVAIAVQLPSGAVDDTVALGEFWPKVRADFPHIERQMPLPPAREDFDVPPKPVPPIQFVPLEAQVQRYWFVSADQTRLIQLQADKFILNWRRRSDSDVYPRYANLMRDFEKRLKTLLQQALPSDWREQAEPEWCELTYINHVDATGKTDQEHKPLSDVLRLVARPRSRELLPPEDTQLQQRSRILDDNGEPIGRLYVAAVPGWRQEDGRPIYSVSLVARLRPAESTVKAMCQTIDRAHELIVRTFVGITTPTMHRRWELKGTEDPE